MYPLLPVIHTHAHLCTNTHSGTTLHTKTIFLNDADEMKVTYSQNNPGLSLLWLNPQWSSYIDSKIQVVRKHWTWRDSWWGEGLALSRQQPLRPTERTADRHFPPRTRAHWVKQWGNVSRFSLFIYPIISLSLSLSLSLLSREIELLLHLYYIS